MAITLIKREKDGKKTPTRTYSKKQEDYVAKKFNGRRQPNSGATPFAPGDVILDNFLIECKTKTKSSDSISIKKDWFKKIREEAIFLGKQHIALTFNFGPDEENFYIITEDMFNELINKEIDIR